MSIRSLCRSSLQLLWVPVGLFRLSSLTQVGTSYFYCQGVYLAVYIQLPGLTQMALVNLAPVRVYFSFPLAAQASGLGFPRNILSILARWALVISISFSGCIFDCLYPAT